MARKERKDALAQRLDEEQYELLREWLTVPGADYESVCERVETEFGESTSTGALYNFYHRHCVGFRLRKARDLARDVKKVLAESDESFDEASMALAEQRAFEIAVENGGDVNDLVSLQRLKIERIKLQLQTERLDIDKRKVELLEKKAGLLDDLAEAAGDETLSDAEIRQRTIAAVDDILMPNQGAKK